MCKRSSELIVVDSMVTEFVLMTSGSQTLILNILMMLVIFVCSKSSLMDEESNLLKLLNCV